MSERVTGQELKAMLQAQIGEALIRELLPDGRREGRLWSALAPQRADKRRGSFKVFLDHGRFGGWNDYAAGEKGDLIQLIGLVKGTDVGGAMAWARQRLGLDARDPARIREVRRQAQASRAKAEQDEAERAARKARRVITIASEARPVWRNPSFAAETVRTYLAGRGIDLEAIEGLERGELRCSQLEHWMTAKWEGGRKVKPGHTGPAMVWPVRDVTGVVRAVHCTWLSDDGRDKARIASPKLMLGDVLGNVIQIKRCTDGAGVLVIGEGTEDGLSFAMECGGAAVWAATSLANLGNAPLDLPWIRKVIVLRDNAWQNPQAQAQFDTAMERLEGFGKPITEIASHIGKDFNDCAQEEADDDVDE